MKAVLCLAITLCSGLVRAGCPDHPFTAPEHVVLTGDAVLIVTHGSASFDPRLSSKRGVDEATGFARRTNIPVIYLQDDGLEQDYFMDECEPDYWVFSKGGEISFEVKPAHVYIVGGHLEKCLSSTVHDVLSSWSQQGRRNLTLTYLMDAIYSHGSLMEKSDPFYPDWEVFKRAVTHGRAGGEHWPKLTLLETMGLINNEGLRLEFLGRVIRNTEAALLPGYRVELQLNDLPVKVLQSGTGRKPPTLRYRFVDSVVKLESLALSR